MALVKVDDAEQEIRVYLTELGRQKMLEQGFEPDTFSVGDTDANYLLNVNTTTHIADLTGDYDDNVYSLSEHIKIKNTIIK